MPFSCWNAVFMLETKCFKNSLKLIEQLLKGSFALERS